jgi:hypothetical protein
MMGNFVLLHEDDGHTVGELHFLKGRQTKRSLLRAGEGSTLKSMITVINKVKSFLMTCP